MESLSYQDQDFVAGAEQNSSFAHVVDEGFTAQMQRSAVSHRDALRDSVNPGMSLRERRRWEAFAHVTQETYESIEESRRRIFEEIVKKQGIFVNAPPSDVSFAARLSNGWPIGILDISIKCHVGYVSIIVDPTYQNKGIGAILVRESMTWLEQNLSRSLQMLGAEVVPKSASERVFYKSGWELVAKSFDRNLWRYRPY